MRVSAAGHTVAEQVAALPPLSQLLGIDGTNGEVEAKKATKKKRVFRSTTATTSKSTELVSTGARKTERQKTQQAVPQSPPQSSPSTPVAAAATTDMRSKANASFPSAAEKEGATVTPSRPSFSSTSSSSRYPGGLREWHHVQATLQLPLAYRGEDDIKLTLRLLRALPFFATLLDHDLLTLAETMSLVEVAEAGTVLLRKRVTLPRLSSVSPVVLPPLPGSATMPVLPLTPSAFAGGSTLLLSDDDEDGATAARPSWMIPAAELFEHFRAQMAQGDQPSLPAVCLTARASATATSSLGSRNGRGQNSIKRASGNDMYEATGASRHHSALELDQSATPLFEVPEGWEEDGGNKNNSAAAAYDDRDPEEPFVMVLLSGYCELRWPRQRGPGDAANTPRYYAYKVHPGDAMGYALVWAALPAGAQYVTSDTCVLLKVGVEGQSNETRDRLHRACRRANEVVYRAQKAFLAEKLLHPLFTNTPAGAATSKEEPGKKAEEDTAASVASTAGAERRSDMGSGSNSRLSSTARSVATHHVSTPPVDVLLDVAARRLIPIRVSSETVLLQEGLSPVTECALYFVVEGSCAVVRRLRSQDQQRLEARKAQLVKELTLPNGTRPVLSAMPSTMSMEVAQLRPGDYCGDLAYLCVDPDHTTSIDAEWTAVYWHNTLVPPAAADTGGVKESAQTSGLRTHQQNLRSAGGANSGGGTRNEEAATSKSLFRRHKATVVTQRSAQLFVLLPSAAAEVVRGAVLERMKDHALAYPSYASLLTEYEKLFKWAIYKEKVLWEQSKKAPAPLR